MEVDWIELASLWAGGALGIAALPDDVGAWAPIGIWLTIGCAAIRSIQACPM